MMMTFELKTDQEEREQTKKEKEKLLCSRFENGI